MASHKMTGRGSVFRLGKRVNVHNLIPGARADAIEQLTREIQAIVPHRHKMRTLPRGNGGTMRRCIICGAHG